MNQNLKIFLVGLFLSLPFWWGINYFQDSLEDVFYAQISQPLQEMSFVKIPEKTEKPKLELQAKSVIAVKVNKFGKKKILFQKRGDLSLPIASLTKLMTALIVLEDSENYNFSKIVTISKEAADQENVPNYGNLKTKEALKVEELLELMLIYSSNDAAWALSEVIGEENFVEKMNQKAQELGLENTHFVNPTGLDPAERQSLTNLSYFNYSTTKDLVRLAQYILKNHPFIFETSLKTGPYLTKNGISNLVLEDNKEVLGGKTGYTDEAGGCILLVFRDEKESAFFNVILGTPSVQNRIDEMQKLIYWLDL